MKEVGFEHMHGIWHCLACYGCATMNGLLALKERRHLGALGKAGKAGGAGAQKRLQAHCSASSLMDLQQYAAALAGRK